GLSWRELSTVHPARKKTFVIEQRRDANRSLQGIPESDYKQGSNCRSNQGWLSRGVRAKRVCGKFKERRSKGLSRRNYRSRCERCHRGDDLSHVRDAQIVCGFRPETCSAQARRPDGTCSFYNILTSASGAR